MEQEELIQRIKNGEDSYTQFKENITNSDKLAEELVAFSNSVGGLLIVGVGDNNEVVGLTDDDIRRLNQLLGNVVNSNITPPIYPLTQVKNIEDKKILIVSIDEGYNKPYATNKGFYLTKAGSDKRKLSPQELKRLFTESKSMFADEEPINRSDITDLNQQLFNKFLGKYDKKLYEELKNGSMDLKKLLQNFDIMKDNNLTLAGNLIFGLDPQRFCKSFYVNCCYFDGNDISVTRFINERRIYGDFETLYTKATDFIKSSLINRQVEDNFNSNGVPEISHEVISELVVNALIHRDYHINSSIKIFIFHDRVEIISPGKLYNALTIEKIKIGTSIRRNQTLDRICHNVLPYTGRGSGIKRVLSIDPNIEFINDIDKEEFKCIISR